MSAEKRPQQRKTTPQQPARASAAYRVSPAVRGEQTGRGKPAQNRTPRPAQSPQGSRKVHVVQSTLQRREGRNLPVARRNVTRNYVMEDKRNPIRKPFPFAFIFACVVIVAVAMYVLSLRIKLDNLAASISQAESQIAADSEELNALRVRLGAKYDLSEIERIAREEYGMVNKDTLPKKYVSIAGDDEIDVFEED